MARITMGFIDNTPESRWGVYIMSNVDRLRMSVLIGEGKTREDAEQDALTTLTCLTVELVNRGRMAPLSEVHRRAALFLSGEMSREALAEACAAVPRDELQPPTSSEAL